MFRAHAFTMLMQLYAYRWQDSNNGAGNKWTWKIPKRETDYNKLVSLD